MKKTHMLFNYPGGKWRLAKKSALYYPPHQHYVSVFGGSGSEIMRKAPSPLETINDKDKLIDAVWQVLQDEDLVRELIGRLENTPDGRSQYERCHSIITSPAIAESTVTLAWAYLVCANIGFHGPHPALTRSWARYRDPRFSRARRLRRLPQTIKDWKRRFQNVRVECDDWQKIVELYDGPDTFFYCDPPYHPDTFSGPLYQHQFTDADHRELLQVLNQVEGFVMLCGLDHELYDEELVHWRKVKFPTRSFMSSSSYKRPRTEIIWMNYEADGKKNHEHKARIAMRYVAAVGDHEAREYVDLALRTRTLGLNDGAERESNSDGAGETGGSTK